MEKVCCIDTNEIFENTNFRRTINNSPSREDSMNFSRNPYSEVKGLPSSDINSNPAKTPKIKIASLSRIPISTKNVIRKVSGNPFDYYKLIKKLGQGTFGQVYKIMNKQTGNIRAMKIIPKNNLRPGFTDKDIIHEITIMKNLDHPHIIKLYEFYIDEFNYYLINEYCTEGDLSEKMIKLKSLPEPIVKIIMAQIFNAVLYLNNRGIIHGDLKLENILIDSYLNDGNKNNQKENNNFISSLIQDAKEIKNDLKNLNLRRSASHFLNNFQSNNLLNKQNDKIKGKNEINNNNKILNISNINKEEHRKTLQLDIMELAKVKNEKKVPLSDIKESEEKKWDENNLVEERKDNIDKFEINEVEEKLVNKKNDSNFQKEEDNNSSIGSNDLKDSDSENNSFNNNINTPTKKINKLYYQLKFKDEDDDNSSENNKKIEKPNLFKSLKKYKNEEQKDDFESNICVTETKDLRKSTINYNKLKIKNFELKLIDFGCSKIFTQYRRTFEDTIGTLVYCSPEVLKNNYNQKCDIWSCGVIMYILLSGKYPFYGRSEEEITKKILIGDFNFDDKHFKNVSENAKDLIKKCLIHDKNKRITVKEALRHEFFASEININNIFEDKIDTKKTLKSLKLNSRKISKFYQTVLAYLSYNFADKEELNRLRKIFYKIDLNLDGKLSKEELFIAYKEAGIKINPEELEKLIKSIDFDGNGSIEFEEFIRMTLPKEQLFTDINLKNAFDMFDLDKNGSISMSEILEVIGADKEIDKNVIEELRAEILRDGDEEIDFKHFKEIMLELKNENNICL